MRDQGANVTLITGPTNLPDPKNITVRHVVTAQEMYQAVQDSLPADIAIFAAAVGDWRVANETAHKMKKTSQHNLTLTLQENPDILHAIATHPTLRLSVVGFMPKPMICLVMPKRMKKTRLDFRMMRDARHVLAGKPIKSHY